ncbi:MAG: hypothetical protein OXI96_06025 [Acidimicrobiaceae bacterium]|nr:hypothetical protein [Acidimicrobiaceae bacterium]
MNLQPPDPELLDALRLEFGDNGQRAVRFLETAHALLGLDEKTFPSVGSAVAYCLREAMTSVLDSAILGPSDTWSDVSHKVVEARKHYEKVKKENLLGEEPDNALEVLFRCITELEDFHEQESLRQQQLIAVIIERTGVAPLSSGAELVTRYKKLLDHLNRSLHGSYTSIDAEKLWSECIDVCRRLFMPPKIRNSKLLELAQNESPMSEDVEAVRKLLVSPQHLRYFLSKVTSPVWLDTLKPTGILNPPGVEGGWPAFSGVVRLAGDYPNEVAAWLEKMYSSHEAEPESCAYIANAALNIGGSVFGLVLKAVKRYPQHRGLIMLAINAVDKLDASDEFIESFADVLLNESIRSTFAIVHVEPLMKQLSSGINEANALQRIQLLCYKIRSVSADHSLCRFEWPVSGSVADQDDSRQYGHWPEDRFDALLSCMVDSIKRAWVWVPVGELLELLEYLLEDLLEDLPIVLRQRLRAWILGSAPNVDPNLLVREVEHAIASRKPTGDDLTLIERAAEDCEPLTYVDRWRNALGSAPTIEQAAAAVKATEKMPSEWSRVLYWFSLLPDKVTEAWATPCDILAAPYNPPGRERLKRQPRVRAMREQSPFSLEQLRSMAPDSAANMICEWRPDPNDWLVTASALARTLESVVKDDPQQWFASPLRIITKLHHPIYISRYLQAAANVVSNHSLSVEKVPVEELLGVIKIVRINPWLSVVLGDDRVDRNDWEDAEKAAGDLIEAIIRSGCTLNDRVNEIWEILESEARNCSRNTVVGLDDDPYARAINRRCTRALTNVLLLVEKEHRESKTIRAEAISLLNMSLRLTGRDGAEHRSILAPRIGFLRHVLPAWTESNRDLLFGDEAPEDLGQTTIDLALQRGHTDTWLLENFRDGVCNAVERGVKNALDHLLVAMLWEIPGYSIKENVDFLLRSSKSPELPGLVSRSAIVLSKILRNSELEQRYLEIAEKFSGVPCSETQPAMSFWPSDCSQRWTRWTLNSGPN